MIHNYHTHHAFCNHAVGKTEDYLKEAIKQGFVTLGMSDHAPFDWLKDPIRMREKTYVKYLDECREMKQKYKGIIDLKIGLEAEYFPSQKNRYVTWLKTLDYLILGQHYIYDPSESNRQSSFNLKTKTAILRYGDIIETALNTGYFKILAHPDVYLTGYIEFDETAKQVAKQICKAAKQNNCLLEFNGNGYRKPQVMTTTGRQYVYPRAAFFHIAKQLNCKTILSSDCHAPHQLYDAPMKQAEKDYHALNLIEVNKIDD